jgi:hypothetical protein
MTVINTGTFLKGMWPGVQEWFEKAAQDYPLQYAKIFEQRKSSQAWEDLVEYTAFGLATVKDQGAAGAYDTHVQGDVARFVHLAYENGYMVTHEEIMDNLYPTLAQSRTKELRRSMEKTKEYVHANILNRAGTSGYLGPDGVTLLNTTHTYKTGYTFANRPSPDVELSAASIEDMIILLQATTDSRGLPAMLQQKRLIIHRNEQFNAARILHSPYHAGGANNDINVLKAQGIIPEILVWQYLTSAGMWFVQTDAPAGLITMEREAVELREDNDFETRNAKYKAYMRFSAGWANAQAIFGTTGA